MPSGKKLIAGSANHRVKAISFRKGVATCLADGCAGAVGIPGQPATLKEAWNSHRLENGLRTRDE